MMPLITELMQQRAAVLQRFRPFRGLARLFPNFSAAQTAQTAGLLETSLTVEPYSCIYSNMKTTFDLPDELVYRAKIVAAQRKTTLKELVKTGLERALRSANEPPAHTAALARLQAGLRLGGQPLTREEAHE